MEMRCANFRPLTYEECCCISVMNKEKFDGFNPFEYDALDIVWTQHLYT